MALQEITSNPKKIYVVTTIRSDPETNRIRTIAWTAELGDALRIVQDNMGDIAESGYYDLAVIEEIFEGVYPIASRQWWWKWISKSERWIPIKRPVMYEGFGRIGM